VIEMKDGSGEILRFNSSEWSGKGAGKPGGGGGPKFKEKGKSHRDKAAAFGDSCPRHYVLGPAASHTTLHGAPC
jgi:hypothetical protein